MKKLMLIACILLAGISTTAQVNVSVNIGTQPAWGPVGYDYVDYYYLPDADAYYDVNNRVFVYFNNGNWIRRRSLPVAVDLYRVHKVVINEPTPWVRHTVYRNKYVSYKGRHDQVVIRDSRDVKYKKANPGRGHGHGNSGNKGHGKGKGHHK